MKLKKIILKNIRSYKNEEIEFPEGSILLSGDIGSGKTSVLLGIEFALFGLQPGQKGNSILRNGENSGEVSIFFEIDGKEIIIERSLKKNKSISQDYCSISIDGNRKEISVMELKSKILELLNYPSEFSKKQNLLYKFTVYTPQEEMKQIILEDSETRVNTLRNIFGVDKYKKVLENSSILISKIREEKRVKEAMILGFDETKMDLILKEEELETKQLNLTYIEKEFFEKTEERIKIQDEKDEILKKIDEKRKIEQEIEKTKIMLSGKNEFITNNLRSLTSIKLQIKELESLTFDESDIPRIESTIDSKKFEKEKFNQDNLNISTEINLLEIKNLENENLKKRITHLESCPTCLQEVKPMYKINIFNRVDSEISENIIKIESLKNEREKILENITGINSKIMDLDLRIQEIKIIKIKMDALNEKRLRITELENTNAMCQKEIGILNENIKILEQSLSDLNKFDELFIKKQKEFEEVLRNERIIEIKFAELKKEIQLFSMQIDDIKNKIKKAEEIQKNLIYLSELENWITQKFVSLISFIEKNVMKKLKIEFSNLFAEWFLMLVSENFSVSLDDDFTPIIEYQDYEIDYHYLSGGERTAVALAYRLALNQVINSMLSKIKTKDVMILDEPTDGFSEKQLNKMRDVLNQLNIKQLIIVSHEQKIESFVDNVIKFRKENGVSIKEN